MHVIHLKAGDALKVAEVLKNLQPPPARGQTQRVFIQAEAGVEFRHHPGPRRRVQGTG